jgi:hypothetical protein
MNEGRALVTINARDFVRLAKREELHGGLVTFPSGSRPSEQLRLILRALEYLQAGLEPSCDPMNLWLDIDADGEIQLMELHAGN